MKLLASLALVLSVAVGVTTRAQTATITYYIADGIPKFGSRPGDDELAVWAFDEWQRAASGRIRLERIAEEAAARIRLYWMSRAPAKYGEMKPHVANRQRVALVFVRPDTYLMHKTLGPATAKDPLLRDTIVYLTCLHEIGHALGLGHSAADEDVMRTEGSSENFSRYRQTVKTRGDLAHVSWLSEHDTLRLRALHQR
jgi:hypothetical protein